MKLNFYFGHQLLYELSQALSSQVHVGSLFLEDRVDVLFDLYEEGLRETLSLVLRKTSSPEQVRSPPIQVLPNYTKLATLSIKACARNNKTISAKQKCPERG